MSQMKKTARVGLLDEVRGLCILLMVAYHTAFDLVYLFGVDIPIFHAPILQFAQPFVAGIFIFISGIACRYSRSNARRGLMALGFGVAVSLVTFFFMRDQMIWFGILHFMGSAMLLFALLHPLLDRLPVAPGMALCAAIFVFTYALPSGSVGLPGVAEFALPAALYAYPWLAPLGFGGSGADYFPLLPWLPVFFAGAYLGRCFVAGKMPKALYKSRLPLLAKIGRHTIVIYLLHQPLVYAVLWVVFRFLRA